ncbi:hypothetical protein C5S39_01985 [Candidatus Methanophagaceae archaeon]|jgi:hypothetical protein|nr:hypothetical protein C5S39_01985 [Methanophagales archaeon]
MGDEKIILSVSKRELRERHGITLNLVPDRYRFKDVFAAIVRQLPGRQRGLAEANKKNNGNNGKRKNGRKNISQRYLAGTKAIQEKYKCSFEEAEKILIEERLNADLTNSRK